MKLKSTLRSFLFLAGSALFTAPSLLSATLYWDGGTVNIATPGNGVSGGTAGDWDNTLGENTVNWDQGAGLAHVAWVNANLDTAFFGGTAGTVTLTDPISVGGLGFLSNSGYTIAAGSEGLTFGAATNHVRMLNISGTTSTATLSGTVTSVSGGNLVFTSVAPDVGSTLTLSGTSAGGWSGTTTINAGFSLALGATNAALLDTSGITLRGGTINQTYSAVVNRINDSAPITSYGGTIATNNSTNSAIDYSETLGAVTLEGGQTNFVHTALPSAVLSQNLVLSSLTPNGTSAVTFAGPGALASPTKNLITVTGAAATTAGQIIGSWATTGNTVSQSDYAVYNASSQVVSAVIPATLETNWANATDSYTANATPATGTAGSFTLTGTRNITALKSASGSTAVTADIASDYFTQASHVYTDGDVVVFNNGTTMPTGMTTNTPYFVRDAGLGGAGTFKLALTSGGSAIDLLGTPAGLTALGALQLTTGNNLGTTGVLNASVNTMYLTGPGALTLPSATSDNLHVNAGSGPIVISAPITNNASAPGVLTLVKNGAGTLTLSSTNTYSGGTVLNAGSLAIGNVSHIGGASAALTFGGTATLAPSAALNFSSGTLNVNAGAFGTITGNGATAFGTTTGSGTLRYTTDANTKSLNLGNASGFTGNLQVRLTNNANYGATSATMQFSSLGDGVGSVLQVGGGQSDSTAPGQRINIVLNGGAPLVFDNRRIELLPRIASNHTINTTQLRNDSANAANTWVINTDLSSQLTDGRSLELAGSNTGNNAFNGLISDGNTGGTISLRKDGSGKWLLGGVGSNTYTGSTSVLAGTLNIQNANALGAISGNTTVSSGATLQLQGGISYAAEPLSVAATNTGATRLQSVSGNNTWNGPITVTGSSEFVRVASDADLLTLAGTITGSAGAGFVLQGASGVAVTGQITGGGNVVSGSVGAGAGSIRTLSNATNNYTGSTSITGGTLIGIGANAFGSTTGITVGATAGATLSLRGDTSTSFVKASDSTPYAVTTTTATGVTINVDRATVAGTSAKTMSIGTLTLNNAITNATTFTGGNNTSLSIGAVTTGNSVSGTETLTNNISGGGSLTLASLTVNRSTAPTVVFNGTGNTTVTGAINQVATTALTKSGAGTLTLEGTNSYSGPTAINGGTLVIAGASQATSAITFSGGGILGLNIAPTVAAASATVDFTGQSVLIIGTPVLPSYTLLTASSITGIPASAAPAGYEYQNVGGTELRLVQTGAGDPFVTWSGAADFNVDSNNDGIDNGVAWALGAADKNTNALGLLPELDDSDPTYFIFTYRRADSANGPGTTIAAEYGTTLAGWTTAVDDVGDNIDIIVTDNHYSASPGVDRVQVRLKKSTLAPGGKLFARLKVTQP